MGLTEPAGSWTRRSSWPGPLEATWSSRSLASPAVRTLRLFLGHHCTVCDEVWLHGSQIHPKRECGWWRRKKKETLSFFQEPGRPAAIVSPGAWPPGRHGQLLACTRCRAWAVGTRPSLLPFWSLDSISFIHETFPKSLLCARLVILARPSRSAQSPRARRLWAVGMWRAGRASRRRRFCTPVWRGGGWRRGGGRTGCWGPLESHERDTGLQPGAGHKPAGWALGQRPALRRPAPGWARQWTPSCGREEGVWEMLDASRAGRAVWVWWEGELRMTGQGSSCRDTPQEF